jgi:ferric-dicitrate binding protein FerR (iron transport regulator)
VRRRRTWALAAGVALGLAALGAVLVVLPRPADRRVVAQASAPTPPRFDAKSSEEAVWLPRTVGSRTTVELTRGSVTFTIPHLEGAQRFVVSLPDGEVEVRGTRFTVDVEDGRTAGVSVAQGVVAFRRSGEQEMLLVGGQSWSAPPMLIGGPTPRPSATALSSTRSAGPAPMAAQPVSPALASATAPARAGHLFDEGVASFDDGAYVRADEQLARFANEFPADPRSEDASYLRAVARWRLGDKRAAAALARAYLAAYPAGLRRLEAQRLVDDAAK